MNRRVGWLITSLLGTLLLGLFSLNGVVWSADPKPMEEMEKMITTAKTKADHEAIAAHYEREAKALQAKVEEHKKLREYYEKSGGYEKVKGFMIRHCDALIHGFEAAVEDNMAMAKMHHELAEEARQ